MSSARIAIAEQVAVAAPPAATWKHIIDPHFIVGCIPGARVIDEHDGVIDGALEVKLGPTVVNFLGSAKPRYEHDARTGELTARGADKGGRTRAQSTLKFRVLPDGAGSNVAFDGGIELTGGLAGFLQTGGAALTKRMMADFTAELRARIEAATGAEPPSAADRNGAVSTTPEPAAADGSGSRSPLPSTPASRADAPVNGLRLLGAVMWDLLRAAVRYPKLRSRA